MTDDAALARARAIVGSDTIPPVVAAFFDPDTNSISYVVHDPASKAAAILDSVRGFDLGSGRTSLAAAEAICAHVEGKGLSVAWHLETHVHADHLSAASWLRDRLGGLSAIGRAVQGVSRLFSPGLGSGLAGFDHLFDDGDGFAIGGLAASVLHVPGHTPADVAYVIGDAVFSGDTIFMPDYGTARADFPGGDARTLFRSIQRLLALPDDTRLFLGHDYGAPGRAAFAWETTIGAQRRTNIHVRAGQDEDGFVAMRTARDATLALPRLMLPSVQVNLRGGLLPEPDGEGIRYIKLPIDRF